MQLKQSKMNSDNDVWFYFRISRPRDNNHRNVIVDASELMYSNKSF